MARRPLTFKQRDVTRLMKAMRHAGMSVGRVEIDRDAKIIVIPADNELAPSPPTNEWAIPE